MKFYSQDGQDKFIVEKLIKYQKGGFFLDIGAFDGVELSNTFYMEKNLAWNGICIEPNPEVFKQLEKNRTCMCLNYCISNKRETAKFLSVHGWGVMLSGLIEMFNQKHMDRIEQTIFDYGGSKEIIEIQASPLKDILEEYDVTVIDYCNIDVEGGEMSVLNSIDFSKVDIKIFTIENNYGLKEVRNFLKKYGYTLIEKLGADEVYEKNSKRYWLIIKFKLKQTSWFFQKQKQLLKNMIGYKNQ
jgi:FkbM family methyltransferase